MCQGRKSLHGERSYTLKLGILTLVYLIPTLDCGFNVFWCSSSSSGNDPIWHIFCQIGLKPPSSISNVLKDFICALGSPKSWKHIYVAVHFPNLFGFVAGSEVATCCSTLWSYVVYQHQTQRYQLLGVLKMGVDFLVLGLQGNVCSVVIWRFEVCTVSFFCWFLSSLYA